MTELNIAPTSRVSRERKRNRMWMYKKKTEIAVRSEQRSRTLEKRMLRNQDKSI